MGTAMAGVSARLTPETKVTVESPSAAQSRMNEVSMQADAEAGAPIVRTRVAEQPAGTGGSASARADAELGVRTETPPDNYFAREVKPKATSGGTSSVAPIRTSATNPNGAVRESGPKKRPVIIGEDQYGRVDVFAKNNNGETITDWLRASGKRMESRSQ